MLTDKLMRLGFNDKEAKVYLALLELGEATINQICLKTKIKRTTTYDVITSLKEKGYLTSTLKGSRKKYIAKDPRELETKLEQRKVLLRTMMPELLSICNLIERKPKVRFYEGDEGLKEIYMDTLKYPNQPIYSWVTDEVWGILDTEFLYSYLDSRVKNKIWAYVIAQDTKKNRAYRDDDAKYIRKTLFESDPDFHVEVEIDLYGDRNIGIMVFGEKIGLVIESKKLYNTIKSIFDSQWVNLGGEKC